jgi:uncharacterized protein (DUF1778 family)
MADLLTLRHERARFLALKKLIRIYVSLYRGTMPKVPPGYVKRTERVETSFTPDEVKLFERVASLRGSTVPATIRQLAVESAHQVLRRVEAVHQADLRFDLEAAKALLQQLSQPSDQEDRMEIPEARRLTVPVASASAPLRRRRNQLRRTNTGG